MARLARPALIAALIALVATTFTMAASAATPRIWLKQVLDGYTRPVQVTNHGGNSRVIYVVEQAGLIHRAIYRNGTWTKLGVFLDISERVLSPEPGAQGERGLLGLAFHPRYAKNGLFYVDYTRDADGEARGDSVISEFRRRTWGRADPGSERHVIVIDQPRANHNGGHLAFGRDGYLYASLGDGGGHEDPDDNGQDRGNLLSSIIRINPADPDGGGPRSYSIPRTNPYVGRAGRNEIWAHGLRNPWIFSFDRKNGNLWIGDVGEQRREEVNRAKANRKGRNAGRGKNYGWSDCEGSLEFKADEGDKDGVCESHDLPVYEYDNDRSRSRCSVTGGYVHRGPAKPAWHGLYLAGDFCGALFVLDKRGRQRLTARSGRLISSFGEDAAGRIFATDITGGVHILRMRGPRP